jgi:hypothetical protein
VASSRIQTLKRKEVIIMAVDLNKVAEKLKKQRTLGVDRDGSLTDVNPMDDRAQENNKDLTTLIPQKFFVS